MYQPPKKILENYAKVMVNFALGNTKGIKPGDVVLVQYYPPTKLLAYEVSKEILKAGGHPIFRQIDDYLYKSLLENGSDEQLLFFNSKVNKALVDTIDHRMVLIADEDPMMLKDIDPKKIMLENSSRKPMRKWLQAKEDKNKLSWTLCLYGTEAMAKEAGLSLEEYWNQIIKACFLDEDDAISKWKKVYEEMEEIRSKLNSLEIDMINIKSEGTDLNIKLGEKRMFIGGKGNNIPSFELFTSPDWRGTNGYISFDQPLYEYGNLIKDIKLEFKNGVVVRASASKNEKLLLEMIKQKNADKIGEFSLTDKRFSRINKFMAYTLFDENFGGNYGNTHIALGTSYHDTYNGDYKKLKASDWKRLGFNESIEHCDIVSTKNRVATATLNNGKKKVIYENGEFTC